MICDFRGKRPQVHPGAFVAANATLVGDVTVEEGASVWFGAVLRGDLGAIRVGREANVQDNCVVHSFPGNDVTIGERATIAHGAVLHGCTVKAGALVGMRAVVMERAVVGAGAIVAAGSVVTEHTVIPDGHLAAGSPAVVKKELSASARELTAQGLEAYLALTREYLAAGG